MTAATGENGLIQPGSRDSTAVIFEHLRTQILKGERAAGSTVSQAQVAKDFGVSRGPVREAFRMLEQEGLLHAEVNQRARVTGLSLDDIEQLYSQRIIVEALGLSVSILKFTDEELDELDRLADQVADPRTAGFETWEEQHQAFHSFLLSRSGDHLKHQVDQMAAHTHRYRRAYISDDNGGWTLGAREHAELARLARERDTDGASNVLARHLSRAALALMSSMAPAYEPTMLRAAIRQVTGPPEGA